MQVILFLTLLSLAFGALRDTQPLTFSWDQCGGSELKISGVSETPDPILLPGNISVHGSMINTITISSTSIKQAQLTLEKKELGIWIEIPCLDNVGSCNYNDPCALMLQNQEKVCPILKDSNLPCPCPIAAGTYSLPANGLQIKLDNPGYSWLTNGDLYAKVQLIDESGTTALCLEIYATLKVA